MNGIKARGGKELRKRLGGGKLTQRQMILAKCYECMNGYVDGKVTCGIPECPLCPLMPYKNTPFSPPQYGESGAVGKNYE